MKRVRLGQVGLGDLGAFHAENLVRHIGQADLVRVVDAREDVAREVGTCLGVEWTTTFADVIADDSIEGVVIATPPAVHAEMIDSAVRAGKHVFCEKPVSLTAESTRNAISSARQHGVLLQVGFHRRFDRDWRAAKARIDAGGLGQVQLFRASQRDMDTPPEYANALAQNGGLLTDGGVHDFDLARWLVGEIDEVSVVGTSLSTDAYAAAGDADNAIATLRFSNGAIGVIDWSRCSGYGYEASSEVVGTNATVRVGDGHRTSVEWLTPEISCRDHVRDHKQRHAAAYIAELEAFARAIGGGTSVVEGATGDDALAAFVLASAGELSLREHRPVALSHRHSASGVEYRILERFDASEGPLEATGRAT